MGHVDCSTDSFPFLMEHPNSCKAKQLVSLPNMTGRPGYRTMEMNGGSSAPNLACTPCVPLFCTLFRRDGNRRAFRLPGAGGDHFHCAVEPSPGHIRCRLSGRLIFIHHQCREALPFCRLQRQQCIKILCPKDPDFYTPLALKTATGQHLPALVVYKNQSPIVAENRWC